MKPYHRNPRQITKKRLDRLEDTLDRLGDLGGIVHNVLTDEIIGGNQRTRVFGEASQVEIIEKLDAPDEQGTVAHGFIVWRGHRFAYRQVQWDDDTASEANIRANVGAGSWDSDILANEWPADELIQWGMDDDLLTDWKRDIAALGNLIESEETEPADADVDIDRTEELQEKWQVQQGEIFKAGEHVIICGDCREPDTWKRLLGAAGVTRAGFVLTDPPYGIKRDKGFEGFGGFGGFGTPIARRQYSDDWDGERPIKNTFEIITAQADKSIIFGGNFFTDILPMGSHWIVWDKQNTMPTFGDCELAWTNIKRNSVKKYTVTYNGLIGKEQERFHPTQKPVALFEKIIVDYSDTGDVWCDPFLGSGTTIIAAANNKRRGLGIERLEKYVSVCLERMERAFGITGERV